MRIVTVIICDTLIFQQLARLSRSDDFAAPASEVGIATIYTLQSESKANKKINKGEYLILFRLIRQFFSPSLTRWAGIGRWEKKTKLHEEFWNHISPFLFLQ